MCESVVFVFMTNFDEIKERIASMNVEELIEFCGGDTCENVLCSFISDGDCCGAIIRSVVIAETVLGNSCKKKYKPNRLQRLVERKNEMR